MTTAVELAIGRPLRRAEEAIDVALLDQALREAKDELDAAITAEILEAGRAWVAFGGRPQIHVTEQMLTPLARLTELGRQEAWNELERAGYQLTTRRFSIEEFPGDRDVADYLRRNLTGIEVRIQQDLVRADLSAMSADAVARALLRVPGGRDIASRIVSTALVNGLAQTFEDVADEIGCWEYTAVLDGAVCERCRPLDGTRYETLEELFVVLPNFGPNPRCLGGGRCRCRAVPCPPGETARHQQQPPGPFRDGFNRPGGNAPAAVAARDALELADRVHTAELDDRVKVVVDASLTEHNPGYFDTQTLEIHLSTVADTPELTFLHEVGHSLSLLSFGTRGEMAGMHPELEDWRNAVARSRAINELLAMWNSPGGGFLWTTADGQTGLIPYDLPFLEYLLNPEEAWARAYAQWVALRSGDRRLLDQLEVRRDHSPYPEQWDDDDFEPIAEAIDRLFEQRGWKR